MTPNTALRAARLAAGLSQGELAVLVNEEIGRVTRQLGALEANTVSRLERGAITRPAQRTVEAFSRVLGCPESELGFNRPAVVLKPSPHPDGSVPGWDRDEVTRAIDMMTRGDLATTRRQALATIALAGAALTQPLQRWLAPLPSDLPISRGYALTPFEVEALERVAGQLHGIGHIPNGGIARKAVIAQLAEANERLREAPTGPLTTRAMLATARLADTAASMSWDAGAHYAAQRYYVLAIQLAKIAGDSALAAVSLAALGRQCYDLGRPDDGLELVQLAQYGTRHSSSARLRAMLATREAWAYAIRGEVQAFHRTVALAQDHYSEASVTDACGSVESFDLAEFHGVIGARFRDLARHAPEQARHAQDHIQRALDLRDSLRVRNRVFDLIGLARSYLISGEPERASSLIGQALPAATQWIPGRVGVKLRDFHRESDVFTAVPAIREAREAIRTMMTN